jgi:hypothetical protein
LLLLELLTLVRAGSKAASGVNTVSGSSRLLVLMFKLCRLGSLLSCVSVPACTRHSRGWCEDSIWQQALAGAHVQAVAAGKLAQLCNCACMHEEQQSSTNSCQLGQAAVACWCSCSSCAGWEACSGESVCLHAQETAECGVNMVSGGRRLLVIMFTLCRLEAFAQGGQGACKHDTRQTEYVVWCSTLNEAHVTLSYTVIVLETQQNCYQNAEVLHAATSW